MNPAAIAASMAPIADDDSSRRKGF